MLPNCLTGIVTPIKDRIATELLRVEVEVVSKTQPQPTSAPRRIPALFPFSTLGLSTLLTPYKKIELWTPCCLLPLRLCPMEPSSHIGVARIGMRHNPLQNSGDGIHTREDNANTPSSDGDLFKDAIGEWTRNKASKDVVVGFSQGNMNKLLNHIEILVEKEKLVESSSEEEKRLCAQEVKKLES